jgi:xanthine dehydrogenase D subunit
VAEPLSSSSTSTSTGTSTRTHERTGGRLGESVLRPDGTPKVQGRFAFSSDLWAEGMLWGATLRAPHPHARILSVDLTEALKINGVKAVVTYDDVPGRKLFGLEHPDQPVFAHEVVRYMGEPVAAVAADHPETARRAIAAIAVEYEELTPLVDPEAALADGAPEIHPDGNVFRRLVIRHGDPSVVGEVQVEGTYVVGMQDQAPLGVESGLAVPAEDGGVDLYISTQWLHADQEQVAASLGLDEDRVRLHLAGVGGAFGAREDCSLQIHICLLALRTGRPVKMVYSREESFYGHVHRHPAVLWYRHHATRTGEIVKIESRVVMDGGAYASTSSAVLANAMCFSGGPYKVPNCDMLGLAVRTNNLPCGAMRGFGAVQTCYAHEGQMDRLAAALGMDPVELRLRNALEPGGVIITGQQVTGALPVAEVIRTCVEAPSLAGAAPADDPAVPTMALPGGAGRTADAHHVKRGVGFAVGWKNLMFSEGFDDFSTGWAQLLDGRATVKTATAEVGQGFVTLALQIAREVLGVDEVFLAPADTGIGSAGSTSASRQTWMSGGAVELACRSVRAKFLAHVAAERGVDAESLELRDGRVVSADGAVDVAIAAAAPGIAFEDTVEHHHAPTVRLDGNGQGNAHVSFACAAHRAVVDVDVDLGLVKVVELTTSQDVGRVLNPVQVLGQLEGGAAQGVGLAVMEEIVMDGGRVRNPSFTDYLIPTALDMPPVVVGKLIEEPEPGAPFGAKGVGEPPTISSTAAVAAAIRNATGLELPRVPVRPQDIALASGGAPAS